VDKQFLLPLDSVLDDIPALTITEEEVKMFRHGQTIYKVISNDSIPEGSNVLIKDGKNSIGIAVFLESKLKPKKVFSSII
jgi:tRNA U55 pseudouridine synthase TruB